jgi:hypothetical protein
MTILTQAFRESSLSDLEDAVNAFLAPLVGGSAIVLLQVDVILNLLPRRMLKQGEFQCIITYQDTPVSPQAAPFVLATAQAGNPEDLATAMNAIAAGMGLTFVSGFRVISQDEPSQIPQMMSWCLTSIDPNASDNYLPK